MADGRKLLVAVCVVSVVTSLLQAVKAGLFQPRLYDPLSFARRSLVVASGPKKVRRGRQVLAVLGLVVLLPVLAVDRRMVDWLKFRQVQALDRPLVLALWVARFPLAAPQMLVRVGTAYVSQFRVRVVVASPIAVAARLWAARKFLARLRLRLLVVNVCDQPPLAVLTARLLQFDGPELALKYLFLAPLLIGPIAGIGHLLRYVLATVAH